MMLRFQCGYVFSLPIQKTTFSVNKSGRHAIMIRMCVGDGDFKRKFAR